MLEFIPVSEDNLIAIRASGKLSHEDYQNFLPQLEKEIESLGKVSVLFELEDFTGWDLEAAKDDFVFGIKHLNDIDRMAIVGEKIWQRWMVSMAEPFGEIKYFDREKLQEAWEWLKDAETEHSKNTS